MNVTQPLELPDPTASLLAFAKLAGSSDALTRYLMASKAGHFTHPDGRTDPHGQIFLSPEQAALLSHLALACPVPLSVETGFGMGSSALVITGTRAVNGKPFEHLSLDPFGLPDGKGSVTESYLQETFGSVFRRVRERSQIAMAKLFSERGKGCAGLIYIDGDHHFENVVTDFVMADLICCNGGYIVLDDAWFPPIEAAVAYIAANRPDYALAHLPVGNVSVLQKRTYDSRKWDAFEPFAVPDRSGWTREAVQDGAVRESVWKRILSRFS